MNNDLHILVVGQTPPPYHGQAIAIAEVVKADWPDISVSHVRLAYSSSAEEIGKFSFGKVGHLFSSIRKAVRELRKHSEVILYYPPGGSTIPIIRDIVFLFFVRPFASKLILHFHAGGMKKALDANWLLRKFALQAYGKADLAIKLLTSIPADAEYLAPQRVAVVPNGLDVPKIPSVSKKQGEPVRILFAGTHTEEKGIYIIIEAIKRLRQMGLEAEMHMMGSWDSKSTEEDCHRLVKESGLERSIIFLGCLDGEKKWQEYADADLFFFPTFYRAELMPLVVIEAMAFSLPVVAGRWRGLVDMVSEGVTGFLFPTKDVDEATKLLASLITDASLRRRMGEAARNIYEQNYTLAGHLDAMHREFLKVGGKNNVE